MSEDREPFLDRWSRLKQEQPAEQPAAKPAVVKAKEEPAAPLQPVEELNPDSDFTPFMNPQVDGATRSAALKKLFADAHYNIPDPYEAYSGDWTAGEPIPMEMLKRLNHAKKLLFDEPEKTAQAAQASPPDTPQTEVPPPETKDVAGKQDA
jgi:hypothetical protein